jgi:hypothetical protein
MLLLTLFIKAESWIPRYMTNKYEKQFKQRENFAKINKDIVPGWLKQNVFFKITNTSQNLLWKLFVSGVVALFIP